MKLGAYIVVAGTSAHPPLWFGGLWRGREEKKGGGSGGRGKVMDLDFFFFTMVFDYSAL